MPRRTHEPGTVATEVAKTAGSIYYRMNDGWIGASDSTAMAKSSARDRGWQDLAQYGGFKTTPFYAEHPFEPLFQAGGAHEMPADQVIANGFHIWPPKVPTCGRHVGEGDHQLTHQWACWNGARTAEFPQLDDLDINREPLECPFSDCSREFATQPGVDQHVAVMHQDRKDQDAIAKAITAGLKGALGGSSMGPEQVAAIAAAAAQAVLTAQSDSPTSRSRRAVPAPSASPDED